MLAVDPVSAGLHAKLAVAADGTLWLASWANQPWDDGLCDEIGLQPAPQRVRQDLRFARRPPGGGPWQYGTVASPMMPGGPNGLALALGPDDRPALAFNGNEPAPPMVVCMGHDAVLARHDGTTWTFETAAAESGESATGLPASDYGQVVGLWPALAYDGLGRPALMHKDVHSGAMQHDDRYRADAEFAWRQGAWLHEAIDASEGAQDFGALAFDGQGRPVAAYAITVEAQGASRLGVWAARREEGGSWTRVMLHQGETWREVALAVHPASGELVAAFYSGRDKAARVRRLPVAAFDSFADPGAWTSALVADNRFDEGRYLALAVTPAGRLALAYHRCKRVTSTAAACDQNVEALILAREDPAATGGWRRETIYFTGRGNCGEYASLAVDAGGRAHVAFRCTEQVGQDFVMRLYYATKVIE